MKYEYIDYGYRPGMEPKPLVDFLNEHGEAGWRVVDISRGTEWVTVLLERAVEDGAMTVRLTEWSQGR